MEALHVNIEVSLSELRRLIIADYCALALVGCGEPLIRWKYVSGNLNNRHKRIVLRLGEGIAGRVVDSGRPVVLDFFSPQTGEDLQKDPIVLSESLKSVVAVPVMNHNEVMGVLLVGCRYTRFFRNEEIELVMDVAEQLGTMVQQQKRGDRIWWR